MEKTFDGRYFEIEKDVFDKLTELINNSDIISKTHDTKCLKVNLFDYEELVIVHGKLCFLDSNGHEYNIYTDATLEDLIDIIEDNS